MFTRPTESMLGAPSDAEPMPPASAAPTVQPVLHHDWARRFFRHMPDDDRLWDLLDARHCFPGTLLDVVLSRVDGPEDALLAAHRRSSSPPKRQLILWHGRRRIVVESLAGFFDDRYQRLNAAAVAEVAPRLGHFIILHPDTDPTLFVGLQEFAACGISHETLEQVFDLPVAVATEAHYAQAAYVPSLRVYVNYDGARYEASTKKLFYDQRGNPVPVEFVAREMLARLGYDVVPQGIFSRLFRAVTGRPPVHYRPSQWPWVDPRASPLRRAAKARARIDELADDPVDKTIAALEELAKRKPYSDFDRPDGALPLVARYLTRKRLVAFLETLGARRFVGVLRGMLAGHRTISADWFAYQQSTRRAFPVEVKSTGDTLQPSQKESILWCQSTGLLDYRLLEVLHGRGQDPPAGETNGVVADAAKA